MTDKEDRQKEKHGRVGFYPDWLLQEVFDGLRSLEKKRKYLSWQKWNFMCTLLHFHLTQKHTLIASTK